MSIRKVFDKPPQYSWKARETVKEIDKKPHLLVRIEISGSYFPYRAPVPYVKIIDKEKNIIENWFAEISDNNRMIVGYFPTDLPDEGVIEFGYGSEVLGRIPIKFESKAVVLLDRKRLHENVIIASQKYLKTKKLQRRTKSDLKT